MPAFIFTRPHPNSPFTRLTFQKFFPEERPQRTVTLEPIARLHRAKIPLVWFSSDIAKNVLPASHLLRLEAVNLSPEDNKSILVATIGQNQNLFALEQVQEDVFVAVKLCEWISASDVQALAAGQPARAPIHPLLPAGQEKAAYQESKFTESQKSRPKKGALVRRTLLGSKVPDIAITVASPIEHYETKNRDDTQGRTALHTSTPSSPQLAAISCDQPMPPSQEAGPTILSPTTSADMEKLRVQYFDTLYKSKASVAFFAKGPLARARTKCELLGIENWHAVNKLSGHYRSAILTTSKLDLKYRETIPSIIRTLPLVPDHEKLSAFKNGHQAKRKATKLRKDGLFPNEENFVLQWWQTLNSEAGSSSSPATADAALRASLKELQCREVQLQTLLVLETVVLEQTCQASKIKQEESEKVLDQIPIKTSMARKKQDLQGTLDLLVDKLCIWHTLGVHIDLDVPHQGDEAQTGKHDSDKLRDFCTEVVQPFYGARLPDQCKSISRKFGVTTNTTSQARPRLMKSASTIVLRPGAAIDIRRPPPRQKSLQRVLSDERGADRTPVAGHRRSPSIPLHPTLKRDISEPSSRPGSRAGAKKVTRFDHREVDLDGVAKQQHAKLKKISSLVEQKKELDAAISALRKPNRSLQAREFVDSAEKRVNVFNDLRKQLTQSETTAVSKDVQVIATPKKRKSMRPQTGQSSRLIAMTREAEEEELSRIETTIPSSTTKSNNGDNANRAPNIQPTLSRSLTAPTLLAPPYPADTPTKPSSSHSSLLGLGPSIVEATPSTSRHLPGLFQERIQSTPSLRMTKSQRVVEMTALKKTEVDLDKVFTSAPIVPPKQREEGEEGARSIYEALGWDDNDDDDNDLLRFS